MTIIDTTNNIDKCIIKQLKKISLKKYLVEESVTLPYFEQHKMYKNMKLDKVYTLEELGL